MHYTHALLLCVRGLPLQPCRTSCYRSCVLPSALVMAALCSPGGPCPRPRQPSPRHVLQMFLPSPPQTRGLQALHRAWPDGLIFTHFCSLHPSSLEVAGSSALAHALTSAAGVRLRLSSSAGLIAYCRSRVVRFCFRSWPANQKCWHG